MHGFTGVPLFQSFMWCQPLPPGCQNQGFVLEVQAELCVHASAQTQSVEQVGNAQSSCQRARAGRQSSAMENVISCSLPTSTPFTISCRVGSALASVLQHGSDKQKGVLTGFCQTWNVNKAGQISGTKAYSSSLRELLFLLLLSFSQ